MSLTAPVVALRVAGVWTLYGSEEFALPYVAPPGALLQAVLAESSARPSSLVSLGTTSSLVLAPPSCSWAFDVTGPLSHPTVEVLVRRLCPAHPASPCSELHDTPHLVEGCTCACSGSLHSLFVSYGSIRASRELLDVLAQAADSLTLRSLDTTDGLRAIIAVAAQSPERARVWAQLVLADTDPADALFVAETVIDPDVTDPDVIDPDGIDPDGIDPDVIDLDVTDPDVPGARTNDAPPR